MPIKKLVSRRQKAETILKEKKEYIKAVKRTMTAPLKNPTVKKRIARYDKAARKARLGW